MEAILVEAFGSITNDELRQDGVSLDDVVEQALDRISTVVDLSDVETVVTGMNKDVTFALEDAVDEMNLDVDVQAFYPNVSRIAEEDDIEYNEAWKRGYTWRNNQLFVENEDNDQQTLVDLVVRIGDAGRNGEALLRHARSKSVPALDINMDHLIDRDAAYGGGEESADAEASA